MKTATTKAAKVSEVRFSLEEDFMKNKAVNGMLYAKLQTLSYLNEVTNKRYVYKSDVSFSEMEQNDFKDVCSRQKLSRDMKKLQKFGFVVEGVESGADVYYLPYNFEELYQLVPTLTIDYLLKVKSHYCCKIYIYLLDKFQWKTAENGVYRFTKKEINEAIGLSVTNQSNNNTVDYCLNSLHNEGLLDYREILVPNPKSAVGVVHYFEIVAVRTKVKGLNYEGKRKRAAKEEKITVKSEKIADTKEVKPTVDHTAYYDWMSEAAEEEKEHNALSNTDENGNFKF